MCGPGTTHIKVFMEGVFFPYGDKKQVCFRLMACFKVEIRVRLLRTSK